jgi:thioredoxin reductase (NADPH)
MKVKYFNSYASFIDAHTILLDNGTKQETVTAQTIVIATGGRPSYPGIPGDKEFGITSDDIFMQKKAPGKTLVVGASYVALECAGFLTAFGYDTTVMVRSIFLRGFDQQMANKIADHMALMHTKFIRGAVPTKLEKPDPNGRIKVTWTNSDNIEETDEYDTVLFAIGRYALTEGLNLKNAGLICEKNGKFKVTPSEQTNIPHIYAIGDIQDGRLELTPTAIKAGMLLSDRLYGGKTQLYASRVRYRWSERRRCYQAVPQPWRAQNLPHVIHSVGVGFQQGAGKVCLC